MEDLPLLEREQEPRADERGRKDHQTQVGECAGGQPELLTAPDPEPRGHDERDGERRAVSGHFVAAELEEDRVHSGREHTRDARADVNLGRSVPGAAAPC